MPGTSECCFIISNIITSISSVPLAQCSLRIGRDGTGSRGAIGRGKYIKGLENFGGGAGS